MLESTPTAIKAALQRARASLADTRAGHRHEPAGGTDSETETDLARRFASSYEVGDVDGVVALLTDDAWLAMPPAPHEYLGREAIAAFMRASTGWREGRQATLVPARANGQPAFVHYLRFPGAQLSAPTSIVVLTICADRISRITHFLDSDLPRHFQLPRCVDPGEAVTSGCDRPRVANGEWTAARRHIGFRDAHNLR